MHEKILLHRHGVQIWYPDRFTPHNRQTLFRMKFEDDGIESRALRSLKEGKIDFFFYTLREKIRVENKFAEIRDREIAKNLDSAEEIIPPEYFMGKNPNVTIALGFRHRPEIYMRTESTVEDLRRKPGTIGDRLGYKILEGLPFEDLKPSMLAYGAVMLARHGLLHLSDEMIDQMSFKNLVATLARK